MQKKCKTCKHWSDYEHYEEDKYKACNSWGLFLEEHIDAKTDIIITSEGVFHKEEVVDDELITSVVNDSWIETHEDFGCIRWGKK